VELPEIIGGKYRPRSVLGFGATGTVYCVEHTFTGDLLALKVLQPHLSASAEAIARFKGEARTAAKIRSRHVVRIFDADVARELGGAPFLVMELLEGSNLDQVAGDKPLEPATVVKWFRQASVPLDRAHRLGIVHRDLKPENLFLARLDDGAHLLKILDFGIARIAESPGLTRSGQLFGTPLYMAPEQARGEPDQIGPATDIFAMGLIAYRLLTGREYRAEASLGQMLHEILNAPLEPPSTQGHALGDAFDQWFLRSCHPDPSRRFASVRTQVEALAAAFGLPEESSPASSSALGSGGALESAAVVWVPPPGANLRPPLPMATLPGGHRAGSPVANELRLEHIPTLSGADVQDISFRPARGRFGIYAACLIAGIAIGVGAWAQRPAPAGATAQPRAGCPSIPEAPVATIPAPPPPATQPTAAPEPIKPAAMRVTASQTARILPARAMPTPVAIKPPQAVEEDPLSDQK